MEEEERTFTPGQAEAMDALLSGRNVFLSGNAGTGKSYVLNAFIEELEEREVPYLAMAPTGIAAQNLHNGTTIHRTLQVGFGVLDPHDENKKTLTRKVLNKAEVIIIDEVSMCRIDLFERVGELERMGARARTYTAYSYGDVKPSDKPTDDKLRLVEGARVMLLANMPDHGLANGSLGTISEVGADSVIVEFDDCEYPVEVTEKEWKVLKSSVRDFIGDDGNPAQELVTDTVGSFTQIPLRLAFAITIHKSQGQTFERCAVHSKVFGAGMLYVALSRCTTFDGLTVWPKIERQRLYANESVIEFYDSLAAKVEEVHEPSQGALFDADAPTAALAASTESTEPMKPGDEDKVYIKCPAHLAERVRGYIDALMETVQA